jgi:hypothetical protein
MSIPGNLKMLGEIFKYLIRDYILLNQLFFPLSYECLGSEKALRRRNNTGGNKLRTYRLFKPNFSFEPYLLYLSEEKRKLLTKFRISAHKLEIEQGRYHKAIFPILI